MAHCTVGPLQVILNPPLPTIASLLEDAGDGKGGKGDKGKKDPKKDAKVRQEAGKTGGGWMPLSN